MTSVCAPVSMIENRTETEREFLDRVTSTYKMEGSPYTQIKREFAMHVFLSHMGVGVDGARAARALELGLADGFETSLIAEHTDHLDVLEGSEIFIERCRATAPKNVHFIHTLFEEFSVARNEDRYDCAFASYVLEHVEDTQVVLRMVKAALKPGGLLFAIVPNARAASRQLALHMGLITGLKDLTENDHHHGHRRVYDRPAFNDDIRRAGFEIVAETGILFKLLADFQMDRLLNEGILTRDHMEGLFRLGKEHPDMADSLCVVCRSAVDE